MEDFSDDLSFATFYFPDGEEETSLWLQEKTSGLSSLTPSGQINLSQTIALISIKKIEKIDQEIFQKTMSLGIISKSLIIRKYILYIHLKEIIFTNLQNKIFKILSSNKNVSDVNMEIEQFVKSIEKLNHKFQEYAEKIISQDSEFSIYSMGQYKQLSGWKNDMIIRFMFESKNEKEINDLSLKIKIPISKLMKLISTRKQQLVSYVKSYDSNKKRPSWLSSEISENQIINLVKNEKHSQ